ncbi:hypothetical protein GDO78_005299 [Eleutherodactylus coqui]|uniref:Uncharacterized protein n=1 Tax=Eleutherodactylus coqui TaxID=57060 RepID=A0A8J6KHI3_ELECQ|nr:hypothetical protein GDO78_005299 [Eleutherodactylus coqui]
MNLALSLGLLFSGTYVVFVNRYIFCSQNNQSEDMRELLKRPICSETIHPMLRNKTFFKHCRLTEFLPLFRFGLFFLCRSYSDDDDALHCIKGWMRPYIILIRLLKKRQS